MEESKQISIKELLGNKIAKVTGSNKSKARMPIISKLQKYYYEKKLE